MRGLNYEQLNILLNRAKDAIKTITKVLDFCGRISILCGILQYLNIL